METKPFNLQSPEQIAKDYGGNKQKIAQAASMGMVDPTAAVLAGMFIDRMRSAAMQEQQPQGTVAQQVFAPQQPQPMPQQPQPGAPMQPQPPSAPMGAPPGMAMGGLMGLPVPDDMFEEPTVDAENFAGGGLVAFAAGGEADDDYDIGDMMRQMFTPSLADQRYSRAALLDAGRLKKEGGRKEKEGKKDRPAFRQQDSQSEAARSVLAGGPPVAPTAYRAVPPPSVGDSSVFMPPGLMAQGSFDAPRAFAASPTAAPTTPAARDPAYKGPPVTADVLRALLTKPSAAPAAPATAPAPPSGLGAIAAPQGGPRAPVPGAPIAPGAPSAPQAAGPSGVEGYMAQFQQLMGPQAATPYRDRLAAAAEAKLDPKAMAAQKKQDMWQAVAQFGFNMAATNSPYFMQAAGQAGAATVPAMSAMAKERKAMERDALKQLADIEGLTAAEKKQALRDGFAYATRRVEQDEEMDYKRDVLDETKRENRVREGLAAARGGGGGGGGGGAGAGTPDFPGGALGAFATSRYQDIMALMGEKLKSNPKAMAAYTADPAGYLARYRRTAYREALRLGRQDAEGGVGRPGRPPRPGAPAPASAASSGWGEMTVK